MIFPFLLDEMISVKIKIDWVILIVSIILAIAVWYYVKSEKMNGGDLTNEAPAFLKK